MAVLLAVVFFAVDDVVFFAVPDADVFAGLFFAAVDVLLVDDFLAGLDVPVRLAAAGVLDVEAVLAVDFLAADRVEVDADLAAAARFVGADAEVVVRAGVLVADFFAAVVVTFGNFLAPDT